MTTPDPGAASTGELVVLDDAVLVGLTARTWWRFVPELVAIVCTAALPIVIGVGVVARYTGWYRVPWAQDVTEILFVWLVFLGGALAVKHEAHVRMSGLSDRFTEAWPAFGRAWRHVLLVSPILLGLLLLVVGVPLVELSMRRELPSLRLPTGYFMVIVPASGALITLYASTILVRHVRGRTR